MYSSRTHGTNPNIASDGGFVAPAPRYRSLQTVSRNPSCLQMVLNPNDPSFSNSTTAYEAGLLNPNQNNNVVLGSEYYTIGLGYGTCPTHLYVGRPGDGIVPRYVWGIPQPVLVSKPQAQNISISQNY